MPAAPRRMDPLPRPTPPPFVSSGRFTPCLIGLLCLVLLAIAWERGRGNVHRLTTAVLPDAATPGRLLGPGGEEALQLTRTPDAVSGEPELLSATFLPGRGMNLLQLTANLPGHGELPLLMAPPLAEATSMLNGRGPDANGNLSATMGGAFLVPWAGRLAGKPSGTPGTLETLWVGQRLTFPAMGSGSNLSTRGLLLDRSADSVHHEAIQGGQSVDALYHPGTFSGNWPSTGSVHVVAELTQHALDLTVTVQNTGAAPIPVGIGWMPYFNIPSQDRSHALLTVPSSTRLEVNQDSGLPTGRMIPVTGTPLDFLAGRGTRLGSTEINATYARLTNGLMSDMPTVELRDPAFGYGLRMTALSSNIRAFHVVAPADKPWVSVCPETNYDDALGSEWSTAEGSGIRTLQPGESLQWKVRLQIFSITATDRNGGV